MADVFYPGTLAADPGTVGRSPLPNAVFQVFELTDTAQVNPLPLKDSSGLSITSLSSTSLGVLPPVYVTSPNLSHNWVSGTWVWRRDSFDGAQAAVTAAKNASISGASLSPAGDLSFTTLGGTVIPAGNVKGPQGTPGSNTVPAQAAIQSEVTTPGTPTATALNATFVPKWKPNTAYLAGDAVLSPAGDTVTAVANFTSGASFNAANWNLSPTYVPFVDPAPGVMGIRKKVSATYGTGWVFGNAASFGFSGTGTPAEIAGAFGIYQEYGKATPGAPVLKTTQAGYSIANYWGPTTDDSAEGFSSAAILKTTAGTPFTQAKPLTAFEAIAQVETGNSVSGAGSYALGVGSRLNILGTGNVDTGYGFKASVNTSGGPPYGTLGTYYAFVQLTPSGATNAYGVYVADKINSETALSIGKSAFSGSLSAKLTGNGDSSNSLLLINLPTAADAPGTLTGIRVVAPTGQTKPLQEWFGAGSGTAGSRIDSGGNFSARTSINLTDSTFASNLMRLDSSGLTLTTGMNLILSTALGTKFGTATSQKLAFYGATPVIQQARPTDAASIIALLTTLGLCA